MGIFKHLQPSPRSYHADKICERYAQITCMNISEISHPDLICITKDRHIVASMIKGNKNSLIVIARNLECYK
jgi:hypothetical protein